MNRSNETTPQWDHWAKRPFWRREEAIALLLGIEPRAFTPVGYGDRYGELRDLGVKTFEQLFVGTGLSDAIRPITLVASADGLGVTIPDAMRQAVVENEMNAAASFLNQITKEPKLERLDIEPEDLKWKSARSLVMMLAGLVYTYHDFEPEEEHSHVPRKIQCDLLGWGFNMDVGTIKKWLSCASDNFPKISKDDHSRLLWDSCQKRVVIKHVAVEEPKGPGPSVQRQNR